MGDLGAGVDARGQCTLPVYGEVAAVPYRSGGLGGKIVRCGEVMRDGRMRSSLLRTGDLTAAVYRSGHHLQYCSYGTVLYGTVLYCTVVGYFAHAAIADDGQGWQMQAMRYRRVL